VKDYYDVLDVPITATPEELKARYKQLVRVYHPDRFANQLDKLYAERKLKEINEAYAALTTGILELTPSSYPVALPSPTVDPPILNFGVLRPGQQQSLRFQLDNIGATASSINFVCSEENSWFRISKGRRVEENKPLPLEFEVIADINAPVLATNYQGWIDVSMDGVKTRVMLAAQIRDKQSVSAWLAQAGLGVSVTLVMAILLLIVGYSGDLRSLIQALWPPLYISTRLLQEPPPASNAPLAGGVYAQQPAAPIVQPPAGPPTLPPTHRAPQPIQPQGGASAIALAPALAITATATNQPTTTPTQPSPGLIQILPTRGQTNTIESAPTRLAIPTKTATALPTATQRPALANTATPSPTRTNTAAPTATSTRTAMPLPTATHTTSPPTQTATPSPTATHTALPTQTATPLPTATHTTPPTQTATPSPTASDTALPTKTATATSSPTRRPTNTVVPRPTNSSTPWPTATPTRTPVPTATLAPTDPPTPTNSATPAPTETSTALATPGKAVTVRSADGREQAAIHIVVSGSHSVNVRAATSVESAKLTLLEIGAIVPAIGRTIDNAWLRIVLPDGRVGWVFRETANVAVSVIETLPVVYTR
jgi:hypothetical protein